MGSKEMGCKKDGENMSLEPVAIPNGAVQKSGYICNNARISLLSGSVRIPGGNMVNKGDTGERWPTSVPFPNTRSDPDEAT
jgi:hypothetical protein